MTQDRIKTRYFKLATESYRKSDEVIWPALLACGMVVGGYDRGVTMGLADDMGVSVDTVEDMAHAYLIYKEMCEYEDGSRRQFVRHARKAPYIYYSHFRALWDAKSHYKLTTEQLLDLLMDIVQAEGTISSRGLDGHTRGRFGDTRGWEFYAARAEKELTQTLQQPDLPNTPEEVGNGYMVAWMVEGRKKKVLVVAANPQRAVSIARKELSKTIDEKRLKTSEALITPLGQIVSDSKHLLITSHNWLGRES